MEYNFISIADAADQLRISSETMKARLLQRQCYGWVYIKKLLAYSEPNDWLPAWDESFAFNKWRDLGLPIDGDYDRRIRRGNPETRCIYEITGWVILDAVDEVLANGKVEIHDQWIRIATTKLDGSNWHHLYTSPIGSYEQERWIKEADIFIIDIELDGHKVGIEPPAANPKENDVGTFIEQRIQDKPTPIKTKIRSDAEENYIRIIAGLWAQTEYDEKPWSAADEMLADLKLMELDKPGRDTIANALTQAAALLKGKHPKFR